MIVEVEEVVVMEVLDVINMSPKVQVSDSERWSSD